MMFVFRGHTSQDYFPVCIWIDSTQIHKSTCMFVPCAAEFSDTKRGKLTRGVSVITHFTLKKYLKAKKKIYGNSNISPCKTMIFKKLLEEQPKSFKILLKLY